MQLRVENDAEVYTVYADLFLMLFMMAVLMMGSNTSLSQTTNEQLDEAGNSEQEVVSLYVDHQGRLFRDNAYSAFLKEDELDDLLDELKTNQVVLHAPGDLPIHLYGKVQRILEGSGATEVSYKVEEESHE